MSAIGMDVTENSLIDSTNIDALSYFKEIVGNRVYHFFEAPKIVAEVFVTGFGVTNAALGTVAGVLSKLVKTENLIFFAQDVLAMPEQLSKLAGKVTEWKEGKASLYELADRARKFTGHVGSTVGDYVDGCSALQGIGINVSAINKVSERVGSIGSAVGALSRITDYATSDIDATPAHTLSPELKHVRAPIVASRDLWNLAKDVSIFALSVLCLTVGFGALPAVLSIGLPGMILGSRMTAYYHDLQLKAMDAAYVQAKAAKQVLKG